ncbi:Homeodomain-like superfamily protein [Raphanus sativus]|uniref:Transcription factor HHO5 n=1 Tax=Raphanus sativus TaxID=3726 RepID=A0A6J0L2E7_RAPSA|nr:transcription factor HHO5 [Raphanus sativus]XP_018453831.1 transcription factor HHO5-like [Raphanus sativus]XP_056854462.1 transcription factor HHO5-like [Raphanus sativus]KAJ4870028.1 Homeodomain-like superfamily protein [Raphanus sativus]KAJ4871633.1 Homeodomain-like superfamily protein [Raphanus sativus]KAJ4914181.1 Homeodomain-like superfamily protein [Raphanus sativus]
MVQTDTDKMGLNLNLSMYSLAKPLSQFLDQVSRIKDHDSKLSEIDDYVGKLEEERRKIDVFKRELPLCMLLLNEAIERLKEEASSVMMMASNCKLDVGERVRLESDNNKKNWMSSAQLWISNPNSQLQSTNEEEDGCVTQKPIQTCNNQGGAFPPPYNPPPPPPPAPLSLRTPTSEILMDYRRIEQNHPQFSKPIIQSHHVPKKDQRRRWSQELHRKFVDALHSLGGPQVATPKQIREMMRVDGLTNDEVKSHLQKYRMHIRKHPLHPAKTLPSSDQPVLLDRETQSLISLTRSDSPQSPLVVDRGCLFSNNGHSSEDEVKSDGRSSWKSVSNKNRPALDLEL